MEASTLKEFLENWHQIVWHVLNLLRLLTQGFVAAIKDENWCHREGEKMAHKSEDGLQGWIQSSLHVLLAIHALLGMLQDEAGGIVRSG